MVSFTPKFEVEYTGYMQEDIQHEPIPPIEAPPATHPTMSIESDKQYSNFQRGVALEEARRQARMGNKIESSRIAGDVRNFDDRSSDYVNHGGSGEPVDPKDEPQLDFSIGENGFTDSSPKTIPATEPSLLTLDALASTLAKVDSTPVIVAPADVDKKDTPNLKNSSLLNLIRGTTGINTVGSIDDPNIKAEWFTNNEKEALAPVDILTGVNSAGLTEKDQQRFIGAAANKGITFDAASVVATPVVEAVRMKTGLTYYDADLRLTELQTISQARTLATSENDEMVNLQSHIVYLQGKAQELPEYKVAANLAKGLRAKILRYSSLTDQQKDQLEGDIKRWNAKTPNKLPKDFRISKDVISGAIEAVVAQDKLELQSLLDSVKINESQIALWNDRQYTVIFQENERFNRDTMYKINREGTDKRNWPTYYERMTIEEQKEIDARRELINAAHYKRYSGGNLDQLSKNESIKGLSTEETERLYNIPGVKEALTQYLKLFDNNERLFTHTVKGKTVEYSLREATTDAEVAEYRKIIQDRIIKAVIDGYSSRKSADGVSRLPEPGSSEFDAAVRVYARDAEQVAFNLHYVANTFESIDSVWSDGKRLIKPSAPSECVQASIRGAMKPMDGLATQTLVDYKGSESISKWANRCVMEEKQKLGVDKLTEYDEIVILGESSSKEADRYWTIEQLSGGKTRLYAPEARPIKLVGSMWEETKIGDKSLMEYLRDGEEIPWNSSDVTQKIWGDYTDKLDKANKLLAFFRGEKKVNFSSTAGAEFAWAYEASSALTDMKLAGNDKYKRWMLYHSVGIMQNPDRDFVGKMRNTFLGSRDRKPKIPIQYRFLAKTVLDNSGFGAKDMFFPWDQLPWMARGL